MPLQAPVAPPLTEQDRTTIRNRIAQFDKNVLAGDSSAVAAHYTEDGVLLPPHAPLVRGRKAIKQFFDEFPKLTKFTEDPVEIEGEGDLAFAWGTYDLADATGMKDHGKVLAVWQKQADGTLLVARVCWNSDLPAT